MAGIKTGTRGTCRHCGAIVVYGKLPTDDTHWYREYWFHKDTNNTYCDLQDERLRAKPKEWCQHRKTDGDDCNKPVKPNDVDAGLYACGIHMRLEVSEKESMERMRKQAEEWESRKEVDQWEADIYDAAAEWLRENLGPELFVDKDSSTERRRYTSGGYTAHREPIKEFRVDWWELQQAVIRYGERCRDSGSS